VPFARMLTLHPTTIIIPYKHLGTVKQSANGSGNRASRANQMKPVFKFPLRPTNAPLISSVSKLVTDFCPIMHANEAIVRACAGRDLEVNVWT